MLTHKKVLQYVAGETKVASVVESVSGDGEVAYDGSIAASAEAEIDIAFAFANVKSLVISSSKAATVRTNANHLGSPDDTIAVPADGAVVWNTNDVAACPITADVTKLFITNGSSTAATTIRIRVLLDVTP